MFAVVLGASVWGCDPGWFVYARNDSGRTVNVRIVFEGDTKVFTLPAGFEDQVMSRTGAVVAHLETLDEACQLVDSTLLPDSGTLLVVIDTSLTASVESIDARPGGDHPFPQEVRGRCGSTYPAGSP